MRAPAPLRMWAVVILQTRSAWIHWGTIHRTREGAANQWLADWLPEYQERERRKRNKTWRVVRVTVTAENEESK